MPPLLLRPLIHRVPRALRLLPPALLLVASCAFVALTVAPPVQAATVTGSGTAATATRSTAEFDAIAVSGSIDLTVRQAGTPSLTVTADDNVLPLVETVVENGSQGPTLHVRFKNGTSLRTKTPVRVDVVVPRLRGLAASGSGDIAVDGFDTPALDLSLAGSGDAALMKLRTDKLSIAIRGSCDVHATGTAGSVSLSIAGSGDADLSELVAGEVSVRIAGSGDAQVHADKALSVSIAGSGDVTYAGPVTQVNSSVAGSGSVRRH